MYGLMPNGELRQANLKILFERAKQYETASFKGLYNFIQFIEKLKLSSGDLGSAKIIGENDNVIRIMSIHKSKGLEFPVVFLSSTGKQFNLMDLNQDILLHQDLGIGVKYIDYEKQIEYDTLTKYAVKNKIFVETLSEEMRILYVALTRAKEKLIITGIKKDYEKEYEKMQQQIEIYKKNNGKINHILLKKYKKYLDWILLVYLYEKNTLNNLVNLNIITKKMAIKNFKQIKKKDINILDLLENNISNEEEINKINEINNFKYKDIIATKIPTKTSVTKIKEIHNNQMEESEEIDLFELKTKKNTLKQATFSIPNFMKDQQEKEKITATQKGTLIHLCLQKLNENHEYSKEDIKYLIQDLQNKKIITETEAKSININYIMQFMNSLIWNEMKNAKEVYKEKPFYININAKDIYNVETSEKILVQGIIDLYYITHDNKLVLVDYKTDYIKNENELINKYKEQLELYQEALEAALHKKVDKKYIYSTYLGKAVIL